MLIGTDGGIFRAEQQTEFTGLIHAWGSLEAEELAEPMAMIGATYFSDDDQNIIGLKPGAHATDLESGFGCMHFSPATTSLTV